MLGEIEPLLGLNETESSLQEISNSPSFCPIFDKVKMNLKEVLFPTFPKLIIFLVGTILGHGGVAVIGIFTV